MESFMKAADDLDKLLDDFEKNEDTVVKTKNSYVSRPREVSPSRPIENGIGQSYELLRDKDPSQPIQPDGDGSSSDSDLLIDLSEADFAPAPQSASLLASLKSGIAPSFTRDGFSSQPSLLDDLPSGVENFKTDSNTRLSETDISSYMQTSHENTMNLSQVSDVGTGHKQDNNVMLNNSRINTTQGSVTHGKVESYTNGEFPVVQNFPQSESYAKKEQNQQPIQNQVDRGLFTAYNSSLYSNEIPQDPDNFVKNHVTSLDVENTAETGELRTEENGKVEDILSQDIASTSKSISTPVPEMVPSVSAVIGPSYSLTNGDLALPPSSPKSVDSVALVAEANKAGSLNLAEVTGEENCLNSKLMETYLKQGARPKVLTRGPEPSSQRLPEEKELNPDLEINQSVNEKMTTPPKVSSPTKVIGFGDTTPVSVTEADLEALESELALSSELNQNEPAQTLQTDVPSTTNQTSSPMIQTNALSTVSDNERVSPLSNLINQLPDSSLNAPKSTIDNELANLDPFYQGIEGSDSPPPLDQANEPMPQRVETTTNVEGFGLQNGVLNNYSSGTSVSSTESNTGSSELTENVQQISNDLWQSPHTNSFTPTPNSYTPGPNTYAPVLDPFSPNQGPGVRAGSQNGTQVLEVQRPNGSTVSPPSQNFQSAETVQPPNQFSFPTQTGGLESDPMLPPDPPTYEQVEEWKAVEANRNPALSRGGLTLNFAQQSQRRPNALALPPSPILEEVGIVVSGPQEHSTPQPTSPSDSQHHSTTNAQDPTQSQQVPENRTVPSRVPQTNGEVPVENLTVEVGGEVVRLGEVAPLWIPDGEAPVCMKCGLKFTFRKRRHHCRACGKIFCSKCCNVRIKLKYMKSREARVCSGCLNAILTAQAMRRMNDAISSSSSENSNDGSSPVNNLDTENEDNNEANNAENDQDASIQRNKSVLRRPSTDGTQKPRESRRVRFSDGIPAGSDELNQVPSSGDSNSRNPRRKFARQKGGKSFIPESEEALPPRLIPSGSSGDFRTDDNPNMEEVMQIIRDESTDPVVFMLAKNLQVIVKIMQLTCCVNRTCWCFTTKGLATVGQDEIVFVLECLPAESLVPRDLFLHIYHIYQAAAKGNTLQHLSHSLFTHSFLGSREHGGFLYLQPTYQCQRQLILPEQPYLYAVLLQKWELPWAKVFPLRLLLRLGAEFRYYPCPLMSVRYRKPVFGEIGHTIMNLLADFKNYQYMLPLIRGVVVHMQDHETIVQLPRNRYDDVMKVINNSNEHVMAIGANFSPAADSHLVCIQNDSGVYQTQAINRQNKPRKVTGASFMVLNGALKSSVGLTAKSSIVEDGLMIQIRPEMMMSLRQALRDMEDFTIPCGVVDAPKPDETVTLTWVDDDTAFNIGVTSPVDGKPLEGVESIRIQNTTDFQGQEKLIRWTEVFFLENGGGDSLSKKHIPEPVDLSRLAESLAIAFCLALSDSLLELMHLGLVKLGLRVTVDLEKVGYEVGSRGHALPDQYMNNLDDLLIPVLHNAVTQQEGGPIIMELIFYVID